VLILDDGTTCTVEVGISYLRAIEKLGRRPVGVDDRL
jgi:hypothetical protein